MVWNAFIFYLWKAALTYCMAHCEKLPVMPLIWIRLCLPGGIVFKYILINVSYGRSDQYL